MLRHFRLKTRWSLCSVTNFVTWFCLATHGVHYFCYAARSVEASGAQRMTGMNGPILNLFPTSPPVDEESYTFWPKILSLEIVICPWRYPSLVTSPEKCVKHYRFRKAMGHHALARKSNSKLDPLRSIKLRHSGTTCFQFIEGEKHCFPVFWSVDWWVLQSVCYHSNTPQKSTCMSNWREDASEL